MCYFPQDCHKFAADVRNFACVVLPFTFCLKNYAVKKLQPPLGKSLSAIKFPSVKKQVGKVHQDKHIILVLSERLLEDRNPFSNASHRV